jgi:hypothetical protein
LPFCKLLASRGNCSKLNHLSYRKFSLIDALLAFFNTRDIRFLEKSEGFKERLGAINHIFKGIFIRETKGGRKGGRRKIKGFQSDGALYQFENDDGVTLTIAVSFATFTKFPFEAHRKCAVATLPTGEQSEVGAPPLAWGHRGHEAEADHHTHGALRHRAKSVLQEGDERQGDL